MSDRNSKAEMNLRKQNRQIVLHAMSDGRERTLNDISAKTGICLSYARKATYVLSANGSLVSTEVKQVTVYRKV